MANHTDSGRLAKIEGHAFEKKVAAYLTKTTNSKFLVKGQSYTKIDLISEDSRFRMSLKNPTGKNTQVALLSQDSFIQSMSIKDDDLKLFINQFFGGDKWSRYSRHRLTKSKIEPKLNKKFLNFLNNNKSYLFDLLITRGTNPSRDENVNYMLWTLKKNSVKDIFAVDLNKFRVWYMKGSWFQNETTFEYRVGGTKLFHLQMKGSGPRNSSGYHSLMFHIYGANIDKKYRENLADII